MTPAPADKPGLANALPIRLVTVATALALALIASLGWYVWNSVQVLQAVQGETFRLLELTGEIAYLNESVQSAARLHLSTKDPRWLARYEDSLGRRYAALDEFQKLAPNAYRGAAATELRSAYEQIH